MFLISFQYKENIKYLNNNIYDYIELKYFLYYYYHYLVYLNHASILVEV